MADVNSQGDERRGCLKEVSRTGSPYKKSARVQADADAVSEADGVESIPAGSVVKGVFEFD